MFKENTNHLQEDLFGFRNQLSPKKQKQLAISEEQTFYTLILKQIDETDFSVLYADDGSPNAPINCLVGSLILKEKKGWSYQELFDQIGFNLKTKVALGLHTIEEEPFSYQTIFNFQSRLVDFELETGVNLLEQVFDRLTQDQLKTLAVKTDIQRSDSFQSGFQHSSL